MSAKAIACGLFLILLLIFFVFKEKKSSRAVDAAGGQALIIKIPLRLEMANADDHNKRLYDLEDRLNAAVKESGAGEYDGNEIGEGFFTVFIYGPSAERLFLVVLPILKEFRPPTGSYLIKRYGKPGSKEDRVALEGDGVPSAQTAMPKFTELSHDDRKRLDQQRAIVAAAVEQRYGASSLKKTATDLPLLQRLIDDHVFGKSQTFELQSLGIAFRDVMASELPLRWVMVTDEYGSDPTLRFKGTAVQINALTIISKRIEKGEKVNLSDLLRITHEHLTRLSESRNP
jgi:hypothetical protein